MLTRSKTRHIVIIRIKKKVQKDTSPDIIYVKSVFKNKIEESMGKIAVRRTTNKMLTIYHDKIQRDNFDYIKEYRNELERLRKENQ